MRQGEAVFPERWSSDDFWNNRSLELVSFSWYNTGRNYLTEGMNVI